MGNYTLPCKGEQITIKEKNLTSTWVCVYRDQCIHYQMWIKNGCLGKEETSHIKAIHCINDNHKLFKTKL